MANLNKNTLIWIGAGLATSLMGYFVFDIFKTKRDQQRFSTPEKPKINNPTTGLGIGEVSSTGAQTSNDSYPLKVGSYGAKVWVLQEALNKLDANLEVDGKFGQKTYTAVNKVPFGFGGLNIMCGIGYDCSVTYSNWQSIIEKAQEQGFDVNKAWTNAKKKWKA